MQLRRCPKSGPYIPKIYDPAKMHDLILGLLEKHILSDQNRVHPVLIQLLFLFLTCQNEMPPRTESLQVSHCVISTGYYLNEEKREYYDKSPYTNRKVIQSNAAAQSAIKKFEYKMIADRLRTISLSIYNYPKGVVNLVYGSNLFNTHNNYVIKSTCI